MHNAIDVVMPTWNSAAMLSRTLRPLKEGLRPCNIIVVDRSSQDRTRDIAVEHGATVLVDTVSLGSARMTGVRASGADWIAFVDDDIVLPKGFREAVEPFLVPGVGAVQAAAVSVHQPYRMIHLEEFGERMGRDGHFELRAGERGFTNATLVRRELLQDLDLSDMNTWEDWVITQQVLSSGHRWVVTMPFVDHIHDLEDLAYKEGWNAAGILNLGRTGRMSKLVVARQFLGKVLLAMKGSIKYTVVLRSPQNFLEYTRFIWHILTCPRHILRVKQRTPKPLAVPLPPPSVQGEGEA